MVTMEKYTG